MSLALTCAATTAAPTVSTLEIPTIIPLTGPGAFIGQEQAQALKGIETTVNASGGINGHPVAFDIADDQSNPQVALQLVEGLRAKHVPLILGPTWAASCSAVLPLADKDGPVVYCLSNAIRPAAGSYVFSSLFSTNDMLTAATRYFRERGWKRIAYITAVDATGQDAERAINAALATPENKDLVVVDREHFANADISVAAQMSKIKASDPQVLIAWAAGTPAGTLLRGASDAGLDVPTLTSPANLNFNVLKNQWAAFLPNRLMFPGSASAVPSAATDRAWRAMVASFVKGLGPTVKPDQVHASTWDPAMIAIEALKGAGLDASAAQLRDRIAQTRNFAGVLGHYDFTAVPQRGIGAASVIMIGWDRAQAAWSAVSIPGGAPLRGR
jgi:branched-chain amino acid transport system substrate-binding protein